MKSNSELIISPPCSVKDTQIHVPREDINPPQWDNSENDPDGDWKIYSLNGKGHIEDENRSKVEYTNTTDIYGYLLSYLTV